MNREEIQNNFWQGCEIEGHKFHLLNLGRQSLLQTAYQKMGDAQETYNGADQTMVAMAIYNMTAEEASSADPDFDFLLERAKERGLDLISLHGGAVFAAGMARDLEAMNAVATKTADAAE